MDGPEPPPASADPAHSRPGPPRGDDRERAFNAPWPVLAASGLLLAVHLGQRWLGGAEFTLAYSLVPIELSAGRLDTLITHQLLHRDWLHLLLNAAALVAFGAPVARVLGLGLAGAVRFTTFLLVCGVAGGLAFWALQPLGAGPALGASGAVSGLIGGAARLLERRGHVGRPFSRAALTFILPWVVLNLLMGLGRFAFGPAIPIAWEAHLGGLIAGLLLIGLFAPRRRLG